MHELGLRPESPDSKYGIGSTILLTILLRTFEWSQNILKYSVLDIYLAN